MTGVEFMYFFTYQPWNRKYFLLHKTIISYCQGLQSYILMKLALNYFAGIGNPFLLSQIRKTLNGKKNAVINISSQPGV